MEDKALLSTEVASGAEKAELLIVIPIPSAAIRPSIGPGKTKRRITMDFSIIAAIWHLTRRSIKMMDGEISPMTASQKKRSRK